MAREIRSVGGPGFMSKKLLHITVRGKGKTWGFEFYGDPRYLDEWRADGLDIVEVVNTVPMWVVDLGLTRAWCFAQDVFSFRNPWRS